MPCFLVEIVFTRPFETFGDAVAEHRAYLQTGYDRGLLLLSGPRADKRGGLCVARAVDEAAVREFFAHDPYKQKGLAEHRFVAFAAAKRQPFLDDWVEGRDGAMAA
ncbi:YciI family protein [Propionivibrio soli]|jgi:uncharacterized protein YciI|uniref:YciI family protein n=1 Tax=Propionivibrio soli TaxID=2976531 RepID=UPI0021E7E219|nr:YciI family protein [Propionivibrio soli]